MTTWHCTANTQELLLGMDMVAVGRAVHASSSMSGTRLHVMTFDSGTSLHLTGSDGAQRGALYHLPVRALAKPDIWCVLPADSERRVAAMADNEIDIGSDGPFTLVIRGTSSRAVLNLDVRSTNGYEGIGCFAGPAFREVEPQRYWVTGDIVPARSSASRFSRVQASEVFVEADDDEAEYADEPAEAPASRSQDPALAVPATVTAVPATPTKAPRTLPRLENEPAPVKPVRIHSDAVPTKSSARPMRTPVATQTTPDAQATAAQRGTRATAMPVKQAASPQREGAAGE